MSGSRTADTEGGCIGIRVAQVWVDQLETREEEVESPVKEQAEDQSLCRTAMLSSK